MLTDSPVESGWSAAAKSIFPECLNRAFFDVLIACEPGEVETGQVEYRFAVGREFGPRTIGALDDGDSCQVVFLKFRKRFSKGLGCPVGYEVVNFLPATVLAPDEVHLPPFRALRNGAVTTHLLVERDEVLPLAILPRPALHERPYREHHEYQLKRSTPWVISM